MTPAIITSMRISTTPPRRKPKVGDRRVTKAHGVQIRVWVRDPFSGACVVSRGRAVLEWRRPEHLEPHDRYLLEPAERARHFPPERELGYMQKRGAA